jgi:putative ABC transport system permease protein
MAIPVSYNIRNLIVRKTTTIMAALGIALTVAVLLAMLSLVNGLKTALQSTGSPTRVLVVRKGATSELVSAVTRENFQVIKFKPGIALSSNKEPEASLEIVSVINLASVDAPDGVNVNLRGLMPVGIEMRGLKLTTGRWFTTGRREVVVGESIAKRFPAARMGKTIRFGRGEWEVVGIMNSPTHGATDSEIFADLNQVSADFDRSDALSSVLIQATDEVAADALVKNLTSDQRLNVAPLLESVYYDKQTSSALPIQFLGTFISIIMAVGSAFAATNTMYAAVARRSKEVGTLRVLGFSQGSILFSFFLESILLAGLGGVLGCLMVLPLNGLTTGIGNFTTFSETAFSLSVSPKIMMYGVLFAMLLGALGGFFPARSAAKKEILVALRQV